MIRIFFFLFGFLLFTVNGWAETCTTSHVYINKNSSCTSNSGGYVCRIEYSSYKGGASCGGRVPNYGSYDISYVGTGGSSSANTFQSCEFLTAGSTYAEVNLTVCVRDSTDALCDDARAQCEAAQGTFSGSGNSGCCIGTCSQCGRLKDLVQQKASICCSRGMAPPDTVQLCYVVAPSTCGVNWSEFKSSDNEFSCQSPSLGGAAAQRYVDQCLEHSSSSNTNSSSSGGNSSSGGGSSGSGECQECPYLEAILDTLTKQKHRVDDIYSCLTVPGLCGQEEKDSLEIPEWVAEKLDSIKKVDSLILVATKSSDSVLKEISTFTPSILQSDSLTRETLKTLDTSILSINDTSSHYLRHIAGVIGSTEQELTRHLDSIIKHIPDSVLDSIVKYQKYAIDTFDSAFWGEGNGFTKIDDLTDSAIKYFKEGYRFDSIYNTQYRDSLGAIHTAISDIGSNIGYGLGYGDTASSTLRKDLNGIKDGLDDLNGKFDAAGVDTGAVGFGNGWAEHGERLADSIAREVGWKGGLDTVDIDGVFSSNGFDSLNVDSISGVVNDSLVGLSDSLAAALALQNDSLRSAFPDSLNVWADSIRAYSPFASFDSLVFGSLGAKIPNSDVCPEDCQKWTINLPRFGLVQFDVDMGLCLGRSYIANMNVLGLIRLLVRIVVVWSCIWIVFNALTRRKD